MIALFGMATIFMACDDDDDNDMPVNITYEQEDQMARPAINTVFVSSGDKDVFNTTAPAQQGAAFATKFNDRLLALNPGYTTNLLGLDAATFTGVLATDVLTVSLTAPTTFYDGTNVLTGRRLEDDVITVELILLFGGPDLLVVVLHLDGPAGERRAGELPLLVGGFQEQDVPLTELIFDRGVKLLLGEAEPAKKAA